MIGLEYALLGKLNVLCPLTSFTFDIALLSPLLSCLLWLLIHPDIGFVTLSIANAPFFGSYRISEKQHWDQERLSDVKKPLIKWMRRDRCLRIASPSSHRLHREPYKLTSVTCPKPCPLYGNRCRFLLPVHELWKRNDPLTKGPNPVDIPLGCERLCQSQSLPLSQGLRAGICHL